MHKESFDNFCGFFPGVRDRLNRLEDKKNQRLEFLRTHYKDTYNAVMWLRDNQDKFEKPVHEPIMLLVRIIVTDSVVLVVIVMVVVVHVTMKVGASC
jgi:hypothetical protein